MKNALVTDLNEDKRALLKKIQQIELEVSDEQLIKFYQQFFKNMPQEITFSRKGVTYTVQTGRLLLDLGLKVIDQLRWHGEAERISITMTLRDLPISNENMNTNRRFLTFVSLLRKVKPIPLTHFIGE